MTAFIAPEVERQYADSKPCACCGRSFFVCDYPLGRPRLDGTRHPMRFCAECILARQGTVTPEQKAEARRIATKQSRVRLRRLRGHW